MFNEGDLVRVIKFTLPPNPDESERFICENYKSGDLIGRVGWVIDDNYVEVEFTPNVTLDGDPEDPFPSWIFHVGDGDLELVFTS